MALHAGSVSKAVVPVAGTPMLLRVLSALDGNPGIGGITVVGLADEARRDPSVEPSLAARDLRFHPGAMSPAAAVVAALRDIPAHRPVLITTADHALLRPDIVDWFLSAAVQTGADAVIGMAPYERVISIAGETRRTVTKLRDGRVCGCNLFALLTSRGREAVSFFERLERHRKHPARIARTLGLRTLLRFALRRLTLSEGMERLSRLAGARVTAVLLPFGEAAIDVDKPDDLAIAESLLAATGPGQSSGR